MNPPPKAPTAKEPSGTARRLVWVWLAVGLFASALVLFHPPQDLSAMDHILYLSLWGALVGINVRATAILRANEVVHASLAGTRPHRLWAASPAAATLGALVAALGGAASAFGAHGKMAVWLFAAAFPLIAVLLVPITLAVFSGDGQKERPPRKTTLKRWILLDTALPSGLLSAIYGMAFGRLRFSGQALVPGEVLASHLALIFFQLAFFLGVAGFLKVHLEARAGLVVAPLPPSRRWLPSPLLVGLALALIALFVGARLLPDLRLSTVLMLKGGVGFFCGSLYAGLGGLRAVQRLSAGKSALDGPKE